ncbi:unnamed protein product, partial [Symbiodinium sp. CCMP2456]
MLLVRQFDSSLSQTILENVKPGDHVGVLGDFAGYHTLSLATLVGNTGEVISLDQGSDEIVDLNVGANLLRNVTLGAETTSANHLGMLNQIYIRVGSELQIDYALFELLCRSAAQATWHIHVVDGQRSLQETKTKALDIFRCLAGYGMSVEQGGLSINLDEQATRFDWDQPCRLLPNDRDVAPRKDEGYAFRGVGYHSSTLLQYAVDHYADRVRLRALVDPSLPDMAEEHAALFEEIQPWSEATCIEQESVFVQLSPMTHDPAVCGRVLDRKGILAAAVIYDFIPLD